MLTLFDVLIISITYYFKAEIFKNILLGLFMTVIFSTSKIINLKMAVTVAIKIRKYSKHI